MTSADQEFLQRRGEGGAHSKFRGEESVVCGNVGIWGFEILQAEDRGMFRGGEGRRSGLTEKW